MTGTRPATCSSDVRVRTSRSASDSENCSEKLARMQTPSHTRIDHEVEAALLAVEVERAVFVEGGGPHGEDASVARVLEGMGGRHGGYGQEFELNMPLALVE